MFGDPVTNPKGWEVVEFQEIFDSIRYGTGSPPEYSENGIPFIRATNIKGGTIFEKELKYISRKAAKDIEKCKIKFGDLLIVRSGVNSGDAAMIPVSHDKSYAGYDLIVELPFEWAIFMNHYINSRQGQHLIKPLTRRAAQPHLNAEQVSKLKIIKPNIEHLTHFRSYWEKYTNEQNIFLENINTLDTLFHSLQQRAFRGELSAGVDEEVLEVMAG
jgi:type I restriction enzyme S subunit